MKKETTPALQSVVPPPPIPPPDRLIQREMVSYIRKGGAAAGSISCWCFKRDDIQFVLEQTKGLPHRRRSRNVINQYAADMMAGRWNWTICPPIVLDQQLRCWDGHHRLTAALQIGLAEISVRVEFVPPGMDGMEYLRIRNRGYAMRTADAFRMNGENNVLALSALVSLCHRWMNGDVSRNNASSVPSMFEAEEVLEEHPGLRDVMKFNARGLVGLTPLRLCLYLLRDVRDKGLVDKVDPFFHAVRTGAELAEDSAVYRLRARLLDRRSNREVRVWRGELQNIEVMALCFKAWNIWTEDPRAHLRQLQWRVDEAFPMPVGGVKGGPLNDKQE